MRVVERLFGVGGGITTLNPQRTRSEWMGLSAA